MRKHEGIYEKMCFEINQEEDTWILDDFILSDILIIKYKLGKAEVGNQLDTLYFLLCLHIFRPSKILRRFQDSWAVEKSYKTEHAVVLSWPKAKPVYHFQLMKSLGERIQLNSSIVN